MEIFFKPVVWDSFGFRLQQLALFREKAISAIIVKLKV